MMKTRKTVTVTDITTPYRRTQIRFNRRYTRASQHDADSPVIASFLEVKVKVAVMKEKASREIVYLVVPWLELRRRRMRMAMVRMTEYRPGSSWM